MILYKLAVYNVLHFNLENEGRLLAGVVPSWWSKIDSVRVYFIEVNNGTLGEYIFTPRGSVSL